MAGHSLMILSMMCSTGPPDLLWNKVAVEMLPQGRFFVQSRAEKTAHWLDDKAFIHQKVVITLVVSDKVRLDSNTFHLDRGTMESRCSRIQVWWLVFLGLAVLAVSHESFALL